MNVSPPTFTRRNRNLPRAFYKDMIELVLDRFEAPYSDVTVDGYQSVVMDVWQTQKWFEPLHLLMNGRVRGIAHTLKMRVKIKVGERPKPQHRLNKVWVEENIHEIEDLKTGNIIYEACISDPKLGVILESSRAWSKGNRSVFASFKSLDAARGWLALAKQYKSEGRPIAKVPRETWDIERLEELGREAANK